MKINTIEVCINPHPALRKKARPVKQFDQSLRQLIQQLRQVMVGHHGVGLAANQVGLDLAIFIARPKEKFYIFTNPELQLLGEPELREEGCLSVPQRWGLIKRVPKIRLSYQDLQGKRRTLTASGLLAQIIQHEVDHLGGVLFIDKATELWDIDGNIEGSRIQDADQSKVRP